jgi:hypothetical protein
MSILERLRQRLQTAINNGRAIWETVAAPRREALLSTEALRRFGLPEPTPAVIPDTCQGPLLKEETGMAFVHGQPITSEEFDAIEYWYKREQQMRVEGRWYDLRRMFGPRPEHEVRAEEARKKLEARLYPYGNPAGHQ